MTIDYQVARNSIDTGDVFFTSSPALFSRVIRLFTRSTVSHVGLFVWLGSRLFCVEALEWKGVVLTLASERLRGAKIGKVASSKKPETIIDDALGEVGSEYDMKGALLALFVDTKTSQRFCSEYVSAVLWLNFSHLTRGIIPADIATKCWQLITIT
jgi:hypothetical protein